MQIHITKDGQKQGPFTIYRIKELIDDGDLSPEDLGWHEGLDQWCALKDIPTVASTLKSLGKKSPQTSDLSADQSPRDETDPQTSLPLPSRNPSPQKISNLLPAKNVHPLLRFWARLFDLLILNLLVSFVFGRPPVPKEGGNLLEFYSMIPKEEQFQLLLIWGGSFFVWNFVEALLISSFATTPGKMLFNIRVTQKNGKLLSYSQAIGRSLLIWFIGVGFGIFFLQIVAMAFSLFYLLNKGETLWDRNLQTQVHHRPLGPQKIIFAIGAYLVLFSLQSLFLP
ncbi:MAG: RDD family protein [Verrucomicrobiota bacterium]